MQNNIMPVQVERLITLMNSSEEHMFARENYRDQLEDLRNTIDRELAKFNMKVKV